MSVALDFATAPAPAEPRRLRAVPDGVGAAPPAPVAVLHAPSTAAVAAPLRLTRRGVAVLSLAVALVAVGLLALARASAPAPAGSDVRGTVTVAPGDTLWSIATRVAPRRDPRAEVAALQRRNHLHGVDLAPGQRLRVP